MTETKNRAITDHDLINHCCSEIMFKVLEESEDQTRHTFCELCRILEKNPVDVYEEVKELLLGGSP